MENGKENANGLSRVFDAFDAMKDNGDIENELRNLGIDVNMLDKEVDEGISAMMMGKKPLKEAEFNVYLKAAHKKKGNGNGRSGKK